MKRWGWRKVVTCGYDLNGNLTSDGTFAFAYDPENRLMTATKAGTAVSYAYDPLGQRTTKTVNGSATYFLDSGDDEIAEYDSSGDLLRRYVPGPGVDQGHQQIASLNCPHCNGSFRNIADPPIAGNCWTLDGTGSPPVGKPE